MFVPLNSLCLFLSSPTPSPLATAHFFSVCVIFVLCFRIHIFVLHLWDREKSLEMEFYNWIWGYKPASLLWFNSLSRNTVSLEHHIHRFLMLPGLPLVSASFIKKTEPFYVFVFINSIQQIHNLCLKHADNCI